MLNIFQRVSSQKTFYVQITMVPGDIDAEKTRKTFRKLHINFFSMLNCEFFVVSKNSFSGGKSRKNSIPVVKITFFCKKSPRITGFHKLTQKLLSIVADLILHSSGV